MASYIKLGDPEITDVTLRWLYLHAETVGKSAAWKLLNERYPNTPIAVITRLKRLSGIGWEALADGTHTGADTIRHCVSGRKKFSMSVWENAVECLYPRAVKTIKAYNLTVSRDLSSLVKALDKHKDRHLWRKTIRSLAVVSVFLQVSNDWNRYPDDSEFDLLLKELSGKQIKGTVPVPGPRMDSLRVVPKTTPRPKFRLITGRAKSVKGKDDDSEGTLQ